MGLIQQLKPKKIGVFRALQLGDLLCAIPAIRALKNLLPESSIILIGLPWAKSFSERFHKYFDGFIEFPGYPGLPEQSCNPRSFISFLEEINNHNFDLIIQMQGNGTVVNHCIPLFGAKNTAGYVLPGEYSPQPSFYMNYPPEHLSEVKKHLLLMQFMGIKSLGYELEFPIADDETESLRILQTRFDLSPGEYVCMHPGARDSRRWWPYKNFAKIADDLADRGLRIVFTGTEPEKPIIERVISEMKTNPINLAAETNLGVLAALIRDAALLFSNDTGVSHIAAAVKTPSIVIFLESDPGRWAPLNKDLHRIILPELQNNMEYILSNIEQALLKKRKVSLLGKI